jgi:formiminotetrahydrofolate cyclodeaminase
VQTTADDSAHPTRAADVFGTWLDSLAAPVPAPGGGAASAVVLAIGAAVAEMVAGYAPSGQDRDASLAAVSAVRREALAAADRDAAASAALIAAFRRDDTDADAATLREIATERRQALDVATQSSLGIALAAAPLGNALAWLAEHGEPRLAPDVVVAARTVAAGVRSAAATAHANVEASVPERSTDEAGSRELSRLRDAVSGVFALAATLDEIADRVTSRL